MSFSNLTQNVISTGSSAFASAVEKPALSEVEWDPCISPLPLPVFTNN